MRSSSPFPTLLFGMFLAILGVACSNQHDPATESGGNGGGNTPQTGTVAPIGSTFSWTTTGGGSLEFTATKTSSQQFTIRVTTYDFHPASRTLLLSIDAGQPFIQTEALLNGSLVPVSSPPVGLGGSWTTITLPQRTITNVDMSPQLDAIYDFVDRAMGGGMPGSSGPIGASG